MRTRAPVAAGILISALMLGACGCTASNATQPGSQPSARRLTAHDVQLSRIDPAQQAVELRTRLEELFGQDVFVSTPCGLAEGCREGSQQKYRGPVHHDDVDMHRHLPLRSGETKNS